MFLLQNLHPELIDVDVESIFTATPIPSFELILYMPEYQ